MPATTDDDQTERGVVAYLGLGANLGDRTANLRAAVAELARAAGVTVVARSPVFETEAVSPDPQPRYLNAVIRIETTLPPRALLEVCLEVERRLGRARPAGQDKAPRTIDIDLLLYGWAVMNEPGLHVPHPGILDRPFVLIPLARVAVPGLRHPLTDQRLDSAAVHLDVQEIPVPL